ncbi:hypothetical protein BDV29DRAFT_169037 [Aspergillus leporis]|uniref:Uncharacterized protein n=1 Tax=Aspergillus leporis TaxID=41062 RepID=A0A5N5XAG1_9EURO|nr:hypothetical protein BDV29DRAFT_169037 [Aspergillus leporis]
MSLPRLSRSSSYRTWSSLDVHAILAGDPHGYINRAVLAGYIITACNSYHHCSLIW